MQSEEGTDWLLELLTELQLQQYFLRIRDELNVTRLSHFEYVKNEDLEKIGMGRPGALHPPPNPQIPPAPFGCTPFLGEPRGTRGPKGWRGGFFFWGGDPRVGDGPPVLQASGGCGRR